MNATRQQIRKVARELGKQQRSAEKREIVQIAKDQLYFRQRAREPAKRVALAKAKAKRLAANQKVVRRRHAKEDRALAARLGIPLSQAATMRHVAKGTAP